MDAQSGLPAAEYVRQITALAPDRLARRAFQNLVLQIASPGATLFDFGAGPGIDARFFAERGFWVEAYDVDPNMREHFKVFCRDFLECGRIRLDCSTYPEFLARRSTGRAADLIISNFAPLSLIEDLSSLFAKFDVMTTPDGKVLASVLNPYFIGDMRYRWWWWSVAPRLWRDGQFCAPSPQGPVYRRLLAKLAALARPYFGLARVYRGLPGNGPEHSSGIDWSRGNRLAWFNLVKSKFIFLLFEKRQ